MAVKEINIPRPEEKQSGLEFRTSTPNIPIPSGGFTPDEVPTPKPLPTMAYNPTTGEIQVADKVVPTTDPNFNYTLMDYNKAGLMASDKQLPPLPGFKPLSLTEHQDFEKAFSKNNETTTSDKARNLESGAIQATGSAIGSAAEFNPIIPWGVGSVLSKNAQDFAYKKAKEVENNRTLGARVADYQVPLGTFTNPDLKYMTNAGLSNIFFQGLGQIVPNLVVGGVAGATGASALSAVSELTQNAYDKGNIVRGMKPGDILKIPEYRKFIQNGIDKNVAREYIAQNVEIASTIANIPAALADAALTKVGLHGIFDPASIKILKKLPVGKTLAGKIGTGAIRGAVGTVVGGAAEGAQEVASDVSSAAGAAAILPNGMIDPYAGTAQSFLGGALVGGPIGGGVAIRAPVGHVTNVPTETQAPGVVPETAPQNVPQAITPTAQNVPQTKVIEPNAPISGRAAGMRGMLAEAKASREKMESPVNPQEASVNTTPALQPAPEAALTTPQAPNIGPLLSNNNTNTNIGKNVPLTINNGTNTQNNVNTAPTIQNQPIQQNVAQALHDDLTKEIDGPNFVQAVQKASRNYPEYAQQIKDLQGSFKKQNKNLSINNRRAITESNRNLVKSFSENILQNAPSVTSNNVQTAPIKESAVKRPKRSYSQGNSDVETTFGVPLQVGKFQRSSSQREGTVETSGEHVSAYSINPEIPPKLRKVATSYGAPEEESTRQQIFHLANTYEKGLPLDRKQALAITNYLQNTRYADKIQGITNDLVTQAMNLGESNESAKLKEQSKSLITNDASSNEGSQQQQQLRTGTPEATSVSPGAERGSNELQGSNSQIREQVNEALNKINNNPKAKYAYDQIYLNKSIGNLETALQKEVDKIIGKGRVEVQVYHELVGNNHGAAARLLSRRITPSDLKHIVEVEYDRRKPYQEYLNDINHEVVGHFAFLKWMDSNQQRSIFKKFEKGSKYYNQLQSILSPAQKQEISEKPYEAVAYGIENVMNGRLNISGDTIMQKIMQVIYRVLDKVGQHIFNRNNTNLQNILDNIDKGMYANSEFIDDNKSIVELAKLSENIASDYGWEDSVHFKPEYMNKLSDDFGAEPVDVQRYIKNSDPNTISGNFNKAISQITDVISEPGMLKKLGMEELSKHLGSFDKFNSTYLKVMNYFARINAGIQNLYKLLDVREETRRNLGNVLNEQAQNLLSMDKHTLSLILENKVPSQNYEDFKDIILSLYDVTGGRDDEFSTIIKTDNPRREIEKKIAKTVHNLMMNYFRTPLARAREGYGINIDKSPIFEYGMFPILELNGENDLYNYRINGKWEKGDDGITRRMETKEPLNNQRAYDFAKEYAKQRLKPEIISEEASTFKKVSDKVRLISYIDTIGGRAGLFLTNVMGLQPNMIANGLSYIKDPSSVMGSWTKAASDFKNLKNSLTTDVNAIKKLENENQKGSTSNYQRELNTDIIRGIRSGKLGGKDPTYEQIERPETLLGRGFEKVANVSTFFSQYGEQFGRMQTFLMGRDIADKLGLTGQKRYDFALKYIDDVAGNYARWSRAGMYNNPFIHTLLMATQQTWNMAQLVVTLARVDKASAAVLVLGIGMMFGFEGEPFFNELADLTDSIMAKVDPKARWNTRKELYDTMGNPGLIQGLSGFVGNGSSFNARMIPGSEMLRPEKSFDDMSAKQLLGVVGSSWSSITKLEPPKFIRQVGQGYEAATTGRITDSRGRTMIEGLSPIDAIARMAGLTPYSMNKMNIETNIAYQMAGLDKALKQSYTEDITKAILTNDFKRERELRQSASESGIEINQRSIRTRLKQAEETPLERAQPGVH